MRRNSANHSKNMKKETRIILILSVVAFILNLIWENAQAPFYQGYENFWQHFWICLPATFGDVIITLSVYALIAFVRKDTQWLLSFDKRLIAAAGTMGAFIVIVFEKWALGEGWWAYNKAMPIVPYLEVGALPALQMIILLPLALYLSVKITKRYENNNLYHRRDALRVVFGEE